MTKKKKNDIKLYFKNEYVFNKNVKWQLKIIYISCFEHIVLDRGIFITRKLLIVTLQSDGITHLNVSTHTGIVASVATVSHIVGAWCFLNE